MIRDLATAVSLVHALPGAGAVLHWRDGSTRTVGRHPSHDITVCTWRDAVVQSALTASALPLELLTGCAGLPAATVVPGVRCSAMGGGIYRHGDTDVFATTLCGPAIHDVAGACATPGHARIGILRDELTGTTVVAVRHQGVVPPHAELARALAVDCSIREVSSVS